MPFHAAVMKITTESLFKRFRLFAQLFVQQICRMNIESIWTGLWLCQRRKKSQINFSFVLKKWDCVENVWTHCPTFVRLLCDICLWMSKPFKWALRLLTTTTVGPLYKHIKVFCLWHVYLKFLVVSITIKFFGQHVSTNMKHCNQLAKALWVTSGQ